MARGKFLSLYLSTIIKKDSLKFVEDYVAHMDKKQLLPEKEFKRRYTYSTLKYFHDELGVKEK